MLWSCLIAKKVDSLYKIEQTFNVVCYLELLQENTVFVKSARAMWKVLMVQSCDNDIFEGLAVANPPQTQNSLFFSWRDWQL
jgi:hypothetical protein